jgi:hypothetical protein
MSVPGTRAVAAKAAPAHFRREGVMAGIGG